MENESRLSQWISRVSDWLNEQTWFQQLRGKWEELDPQSRSYLKAASVGVSILLVIVLVISSLWRVHSLKNELSEKQELLAMIQSANDELRRLRETTAGMPQASGGGAAGTWPSYFETVAGTAGIDKATLTVDGEKPGASSDTIKETLYNLGLKHVSIKQVVRLAFSLENGQRPVKLRNLQIDTHADPEGYLDATLAVSGFAMIPK